MEHDNGALCHHLPQFCKVFEESLLKQVSIVDVYSTLYVAKGELVVKPAVDNNHWVSFLLDQICQSLAIDRVTSSRLTNRLSKIESWQNVSLAILLEEFIFNA